MVRLSFYEKEWRSLKSLIKNESQKDSDQQVLEYTETVI